MLAFKQISHTQTEMVVSHLVTRLRTQLQAGKKVLWLIPGGSSIPIAVETAKQIAQHPHHSLSVSLTDERFGPVNHHDSNWYQLEQLGFNLPNAVLYPVISGKDRETTTREFAQFLERELTAADYALGFFGIGADGHTAGIIPGSSAVTATKNAHLHSTAEFERLTITFPVIRRLNEVVIYACGKEKWPTFEKLQKDMPLAEQPAQVHKQVPKATLYTDFPGAA